MWSVALFAFSLYTVRIGTMESEASEWSRSSGLSLSGVEHLTKFGTRNKYECALRCLRNKTIWPCQTIEYYAGVCTLNAESTLAEGWDGNVTTAYWTRNLAVQGWIPIFRAYNGSGLDVYETWISTRANLRNDEGASPLLVQTNVWGLVRQIKVSLLSRTTEVSYIIFDAAGSTSSNWFTFNRITQSTYNDTAVKEPEFPDRYSVRGEEASTTTRRFFAHWYLDGCPDDWGWMVVLDKAPGHCSWEPTAIRPSLLYCSGNTVCRYTSMLFPNEFVVSVLF